jgi:hypothetical protein
LNHSLPGVLPLQAAALPLQAPAVGPLVSLAPGAGEPLEPALEELAWPAAQLQCLAAILFRGILVLILLDVFLIT